MALRRDLNVATSARDEMQLAKSRLENLVQRLQGYDDTVMPFGGGKEDRAGVLVRQLNGLLQQHVREMPSSALVGVMVLTKLHQSQHHVAHNDSHVASSETPHATAVNAEEDGHDSRQQHQESVGSLQETSVAGVERNGEEQQMTHAMSVKELEEQSITPVSLRDHLR
jgi:hypothetical protein